MRFADLGPRLAASCRVLPRRRDEERVPDYFASPICRILLKIWLQVGLAIAVSAVLHRLVLVLEVLDRHNGVHVENDFADRMPLAAMEEKDGRGVAERADRRQAFHVAALDGLKLDGDAGQGGELPAAPFARESHRTVPVSIFPAQ